MVFWVRVLGCWTAIGAALVFNSCGYHVAPNTISGPAPAVAGSPASKTAALVPTNIHTIAIPAFMNATIQYKLTDRLPEAISREFIARTHYSIVTDPQQADAVLHGSVLNYVAYGILTDQATGRTSGLQVNVTMQVSLVERATGKVIFSRPNFVAYQRYEIAVVSDKSYLEENGAALDRLSRDVARDVVSAILENF